ncbi:MAG: glutamine amidotransferase family protein [bacterium]|nr:glutamine amidotransferase family protein [bacterium]
MNDRFIEKDISGCGVVGIMNQTGKRFSGETIISAIATLHERSNGLGGGFAGYGIYPELAEYYCFHLLYDTDRAKQETEQYIKAKYVIKKDEPIPTRNIKEIKPVHILWRYFLKPRFTESENKRQSGKSSPNEYTDATAEEQDYVVETMMHINRHIDGAFVVSCGKNMGIFKGVGYPEDIGRFYRLEEYAGYTWTAHGRFPTNTAGWWGGAHPFGILDWSVVHNGEISSYGINKRFLYNFGYHCTLATDTEVIAYLFDLLYRKHHFEFEQIASILAAPLWDEIERMPERKKEFYQDLRIFYSSALVNGPFSVIVANNTAMVGLNDRIKLRPLVAANKGDFIYISSEEAAIKSVCHSPDKIWSPKAGQPVIGRLKGAHG